MKRFWWLLPLLGLFLVLIYFFRQFLFLKVFEQILSRAGVTFSCEEMVITGGSLHFKGLRLAEEGLALTAKEAELELHFFPKVALGAKLSDFQGVYHPTKGPWAPPIYLSRLEFSKGRFLIQGERPLALAIERLEVKGLRSFWAGFRKGPRLAYQIKAQAQRPSVPRLSSLKEAPFEADLRVDLTALPLSLPSGLRLTQGKLLLSLRSHPKGKDLFFSGIGRLEDLSLKGPKGQASFSGCFSLSGKFKPKGQRLSLKAKGEVTPGLFFAGEFLKEGQKEPLLNFTGRFEASPALVATVSNLFGLKFKGRLSGTVKGDLSPLNLDTHLVVEGLGFELSSENLGEGIDLLLESRLSAKGKDLAFKGHLLLKQGEFYLDPFYYRLSKPLEARGEGRCQAGGCFLRSLEINGPFELKAQGLRVGLPLRPPKSFDLRLRVEDFWGPLVQEPFGEAHPMLTSLSPRGLLELQGRGEDLSLSFHGALTISGSHEFQGLRLSLGYDLKGACRPWVFSWESVKSPILALGDLHLRGEICGQRFTVAPFALDLFQGHLRTGPGEGVWKALVSFVLKDVQLSDLQPPLPPPYQVLAPELKASFKEVRLEAGRLLARGELDLHLARGLLRVRDLFFEPGIIPRYGGEVEIEGLDLALLTEVSGFGRITGRLKGRIKHLIMAGSLPESFELWIRDDPSWKGSRRISLKAVRNLAELGGGSASIIVPFVKNLRYKHLGLYCRLKDDQFHLRGLIREGGREYLLKGPKLFGVDVINHNPKGVISFREMLRRLENILGGEDEEKSAS